MEGINRRMPNWGGARSQLLALINRWTFYLFALAGVVAAIASTIVDIGWISRNVSSILLFEISSLLSYVVIEFGVIHGRLEQMRADPGKVRTLDEPEPLYRAAAAALRETLDMQHANKSVWIVSATGIPNTRPSGDRLNSAVREYYRELAAVMNRSGWSVRILYSVENIERLEWIYSYLSDKRAAKDLEARALVNVSHEMLAPLIIGDSEIFLAQGDRRFHAVRAGVWIKEPSANLLTRNYFDSIWQDSSARVLRKATGIDEEVFELLRRELVQKTVVSPNPSP
jgi:hypothetical protein